MVGRHTLARWRPIFLLSKTKNKIMKRGNYDQIDLFSLKPRVRQMVLNLFEGARDAKKIDEHGNWNFGADFDHKGRGQALNWDLYAIGRDKHTHRFMIVIQIRQYVKHTKRSFPRIRKSYFLLGRNEDHTPFAHAINAMVVRRAIADGRDVIKACQDWMFQTDYSKVERQGDLCLIPWKKYRNIISNANRIETDQMTLEDSHLLDSTSIFQYQGNMYVMNPTLIHLPGTHPNIDREGFYKVVVARRGRAYDFAAVTID
jgi:hypothetical protein